jgi:hypothetical protein
MGYLFYFLVGSKQEMRNSYAELFRKTIGLWKEKNGT